MRGARVALALAAAILALAVAHAPQARAADPILPLSQVTAGMVGEARTVVRGTDIVTFPVTVLDVQRGAPGPGGAVILVRAEGPLIAQTGGVVEGMSGSPVYVTGSDGVARVIGAIAFGSGDQAGVIVGVTPIEQMLAITSGAYPQELVPPPPAGIRRVRTVADRAAARRLEARDPGRIGLFPLTRWTVAGLSRPLADRLGRRLAGAGITLDQLPRSPRPPVPLVPGATMSALVAGGDMVVGAIGTVTYVDGPVVYGFGHPFLGSGRSRFLLADGYVFATIPAPISGSSYKLAEPGTLQGALVADRSDGVAARLGSTRAIDGVSSTRETGRGTISTVRAAIAPDERTAPMVGGLLQSESALREADGITGGTLTLRVAISSPELRRPLVYRNAYAAQGNVIDVADGVTEEILSGLMQNGIRSVPISAIRISQTLDRRVRAARLLGARISPARGRRGQRVRLSLLIRPWRAPARTLRVSLRLPEGLARGPQRLRIQPSALDGFDPAPPDLSQDEDQEAGAAARRALLARVERVAERTVAANRAARVAKGVSRGLEPRHDAVRLLAPGQDADEPRAGRRIPLPYVIYAGSASVRVVVR